MRRREGVCDYVDPKSGKVVFSYAHPIFWAPFSLIGEGGGGKELLSKVVYGFVMRRRDPGVLHSRI